MARFLIGWELGASPDLLLDAADLAYGLVARGHDVRLAVGDPVALATVFDLRLAGSILPAPVPPLRPDLVMKPPKEGGIGDKLAVQGFASPAVLSGLALAWRNLLQAVEPTAVVALGAPVLALAARGRAGLLVAGSVDALPPGEVGGLPRIHANMAPAVPERQMLENANLVLERLGGAPLATPGALLLGDHTLVYGLAQIDSYAALRTTPAIGPLLAMPSPVTPAARPAMTAILDVHFPFIETLVLALTDFGQTPVNVHIRGITRPMRAYLSQTLGVVVHETVAEAMETIADASFVLHHGGARVAAHAMALGVPQALMPHSFEQGIVADMLQRANAGMRLAIGTDPVPLADGLGQLFRNLESTQNAQHAARQIALNPPSPALPVLIERAEILAQSR